MVIIQRPGKGINMNRIEIMEKLTQAADQMDDRTLQSLAGWAEVLANSDGLAEIVGIFAAAAHIGADADFGALGRAAVGEIRDDGAGGFEEILLKLRRGVADGFVGVLVCGDVEEAFAVFGNFVKAHKVTPYMIF